MPRLQPVQVVFDCAHPAHVGRFWAEERAVGIGATTVQGYDERGEHHVVMRDREGNEFLPPVK